MGPGRMLGPIYGFVALLDRLRANFGFRIYSGFRTNFGFRKKFIYGPKAQRCALDFFEFWTITMLRVDGKSQPWGGNGSWGRILLIISAAITRLGNLYIDVFLRLLIIVESL